MEFLFTVLILELSKLSIGEFLRGVAVNSFSTWICQVYQLAVPPDFNLGFPRGSFTDLLGVNAHGQMRFA
jgi:hypothetical protein